MRWRSRGLRKPALCVAARVLAAAALVAGAGAGDGLELVQTVTPALDAPEHRVADLDGDGRAELLFVGRDGRARVWRHAGEEALLAPAPGGALALENAAHTLLAVARLGEGPELQLVSASPAGLTVYSVGPEGAIAPGVLAAPRARFKLRVGRPTFARFVQDVNRDGRPDVVIPTGRSCQLWLNAGPGEGEGGDAEGRAAATPVFRKAAEISIEIERWGSHDHEDLSNVLESSFAVPGLQTRDVNGDARPDLLVVEGPRRSFHLQREDGTFGAQPDVTVDLGIFKDTGASTGVAPGRPLAIDRGATFELRDLDGDEIPDYVIAEGRKVWVFLGGAEGPQFTRPASILRSAEDITALTVLDLDDDRRPDLLLIKVQVPSVATLIRGLIGEWDVHIGAAGYRNVGAGSFETSADWRSDVIIRLPSIVRILKDPSKILRRFEELESRFRIAVWGELDGDERRDLLLVSEDRATLEVWRGRGDVDVDIDPEGYLRDLLFDQKDRVFDLDRVVLSLGGLAERRVAAQTEGRAADLRHELRPPDEMELRSLYAGDVDGDGREEILVGYTANETGAAIVDVLRL